MDPVRRMGSRFGQKKEDLPTVQKWGVVMATELCGLKRG